jgi:hypothetical protein
MKLAQGAVRALRFGYTALVLSALAWAGPGTAIAAGTDADADAVAASGKAGIASSKYLSSAPVKLTALGASWSYNWSATAPPADPKLPWVPMVWGSGSVTPAVIASLRRDRRRGEAKYLLGFNEPDNGGQADMTPAQAAALWPQLERTGLILGSPAVATPTDGWLAQFMRLARQRHLRVNFIALHYYQDFTDPDAVAQLRSQLVGLNRRYHRPIWITEIGAMNIRRWGEPMQRTPTEAEAVTYMGKLFSMLNALPFVQRYAWFTDQCWNDTACHTSSLFSGTGQTTAVGRAFERASVAQAPVR